MNGRHKTALNAERIVQYFCQGSKTVGRAGSVGNNVLTFVGFVVYAVYEHRGGVFRRSRQHDFFCTGCNMCAGKFVGKEKSGRFDNDIGTDFVPFKVCGFFFRGKADFVSVYNHRISVDFYIAFKLTVYGIVFKHIRKIIGIEQVVNTDNLNIFCKILYGGAEDHASDAAETVNSYFNHKRLSYLYKILSL